MFGTKKEVIIAIDGINLYCFKKTSKQSQGSAFLVVSHEIGKEPDIQEREKLFVIPLKSVVQLERAMYDDKKFYMWHKEKSGTKARTVFELDETSSATELIAKIKFVCKCETRNEKPKG